MGVSGAWKGRRTGAYVDLPQALPRVDPAHASNTPADPTIGAWGAPSVAAVESDPAPYLWEQVDWVANGGDGLVLDVTPADHAEGGPTVAYRSGFTVGAVNPGDVDQQAASAAAHGRDFGSDRASTYGAPPTQFADERYESARFEGVGPVSLAPQVFTRGLNGLADNNPDGFRPGYVEQNWVDRKFAVGERVHDMRILTPDLPFVDTDAPPPADPGAYNSPFSSLARMVTSVNQRPMIRREAPPVDQDVISDGSGAGYGDAYAAGTEWVG